MFHVLAHVKGRAHLVSHAYEPAYVEHCARYLGPASTRALGQDVAALAALLPDAASIARVERVATLFSSIERAVLWAGRDLEDFDDVDVDDAEALLVVRKVLPAAELLWTAALSERAAMLALPSQQTSESAVEEWVFALSRVAPLVVGKPLALLRSMGHRGRVFGGEIWVGSVTGGYGPSPEQIAWQAALQSTLTEVRGLSKLHGLSLTGPGAMELAVAVLQRRASAIGLQDSLRAWLRGIPAVPSTLQPELIKSVLRTAGLLH